MQIRVVTVLVYATQCVNGSNSFVSLCRSSFAFSSFLRPVTFCLKFVPFAFQRREPCWHRRRRSFGFEVRCLESLNSCNPAERIKCQELLGQIQASGR